ncbi:MAG: hypothetical protein KBA31_05350 [Alphaproteobacteria bacterium]|nr:hypothetical protein [Alphaproteobacteria bacterium]
MNKNISIRDLQKMTAKRLEALDEPTPVKSGDRTLGAFFPLKKTDPKKLATTLREAELWGKTRDVSADDVALERFGPLDKTNWNAAAVRRVQRDIKRRK